VYRHHRDCLGKKVVYDGPSLTFNKSISQKHCAICYEEFKPRQGLILVGEKYAHKNKKICSPIEDDKCILCIE
jgi:hypothetical protein